MYEGVYYPSLAKPIIAQDAKSVYYRPLTAGPELSLKGIGSLLSPKVSG